MFTKGRTAYRLQFTSLDAREGISFQLFNRLLSKGRWPGGDAMSNFIPSAHPFILINFSQASLW